jgi:hypothetical protein
MMNVQWVKGKEAVRLGKNMANVVMKGTSPEGCTFVLDDGQVIKGRVYRSSAGNNAGRGGEWLYYGWAEVEAQEGVCLVDMSGVERVE